MKRGKKAPRRTTRTRRKAPRRSRSRLTRGQFFTAAAVAVGLILILALLLDTRPTGVAYRVRKVVRTVITRESSSNVVYGEVTARNIGSTPRGTIRVRSLSTGRVYTFYVGWRTDYYPSRYPYRGERVKVYYVNDRGFLKATQISIKK